MIVDTLKNAQRYVALHPKLAELFSFLGSPSRRPSAGRTDIDGRAHVRDCQRRGREDS
jgi:beta-galactosidase beta subunit